MRKLHLDLSNGAAGDMLIAALSGLFVDQSEPEKILALVASIVDVKVIFESVQRSSLSATKVSIAGGDRRMTLEQMVDALTRLSSGTSLVKELAHRAFDLLGEAEAKIHGVHEDAHLHELGSADTFVDVVGVLSLLDGLNIQEMTSSKLHLGCSQIEISHGRYPNPVPVVAELLQRTTVPVTLTDDSFEYLTPTAAVVLAILSEAGLYRYGEGNGSLVGVGYGAGHRVRAGVSGVLSAYLLQDTGVEGVREEIYMLGVHVDDLSGEELGLIVEETISQGALDAWITPVVGKKSRPGYEITVLTKVSCLATLVECLHVVTRSPGLRIVPVTRDVVPHGFELIEVAKDVTVKVKYTRLGHKVEFDDAVTAAKTLSVSISEIVSRATAGFRDKREDGDEI